ncbi:MAG: ABC-F family ATP-binding cassette domain-containing protein [Spirochaetales bacterium]|nr:ABC-F family ATP-binding cassette domain-containing protein [Spirochaetales bacterium]
MDLIKAENLNLHNGLKDILIDARFRLMESTRYGLIGPNGSGKTTLIRLLLGELQSDKGILLRKPALTTGYLPQQPRFKANQTIEDFLLSDITPITKTLSHLEEEMGKKKGECLEWLLAAYQKEMEKFEERGGYSALEKGEALLQRLGMDNPLDQTMESLSGGERSLVFFARAILPDPELLILDEPGNHLDYLGLAWLESFLASYRNSVLIISHNRYLLDKTCPNIMELEEGKLTLHTGNYSDYKRNKMRDLLTAQAAYKAGRREIDELTRKVKELQGIAQSQYNPPATVMNQLGAAERKLTELKDKFSEKPGAPETKLKINFGTEFSKSKIAIEVREFSFGFGEKKLFEKGKMDISCGERIALIGPNGCGKSTFLKTLLSEGDWNNKGIRIGPSQHIGYLSQQPQFNTADGTIGDEIRTWGPLSADGAFKIADNFGFTWEEMEKPVKVLSGGETNRLQLARIMYNKSNFLILDEPTNHMDIYSREVIEEALKNYKGTLLIVSHDRFFLDKLVSRVIEIRNMKFESFDGNFSDYFKIRYPSLPRLSGSLTSRGREKKAADERISQSDSHAIERRIEEAETEKLDLERLIKKALAENREQEGLKLTVKLEKLGSRLDKLYSQWEAKLS